MVSVLFLALFPILSFIIINFIIIIFGVIIYTLISYVFESVSIRRMIKNLKYKNSFTGFIPFYNKFLLGKIVGSKTLGLVLGIINFVVLLTFIYSYVINNINEIILLILLVCLIIKFILNSIIAHKIYKKVSNRFGDILTLFNVLTLGIFRAFIMFLVRNKVGTR